MQTKRRVLSDRTRELVLRVIDGHPEIPTFAFHLHHYRRRDEMLQWLIRHNLTGQALRDWLRDAHLNSMLSAAAFVLSQVKKEQEVSAVKVGRDYITGR